MATGAGADLGPEAVRRIRSRFEQCGNPTFISLYKDEQILEARLSEDGVFVDNLAEDPFLPWAVFTNAIALMHESGGAQPQG